MTGYILEHRTPGRNPQWTRVNDHIPATDLQYTIDDLAPATDYEVRVAAENQGGVSGFSPSRRIKTVTSPGAPGRPEVVDVRGTSVHLQWTAPDSDGGTDITAYRVQFSTSKEVQTISVSADTDTASLISCTVEDQLQPYTEYRLAVAAVNKEGQGPWSDVTEDLMTFSSTLNTLALFPRYIESLQWHHGTPRVTPSEG